MLPSSSTFEPPRPVPAQDLDSSLPSHASDREFTIVFFDHTAKMGGGEISLFNLVTRLDKPHFHPIVVLGQDGELRAALDKAGVETIVLPLDSSVATTTKDSLDSARAVPTRLVGQSLAYVWKLHGLLKRLKAEHGPILLHTNSLKSDVLGALAGRLAGVPVLWHVRDRIEEDYLPRAATHAFRLACRLLPHYLVANSHSTLSSLRLPRRQLARVVYNGIVFNRRSVVHDGIGAFLSDDDLPSAHETGAASQQTPSQRFELGNDEQDQAPVIGLVGRISPWKGQHVFIEAAAQVLRAFPDARFQIIGAPLFGEEDYEKRVKARVEELGIGQQVEFTGFRRDVPHLVSRLTILVHASTSGEPFGQVVIEGMAAGKPVIATRGGGVPEIMLDGQTGFLVPMNDAPSMARAIEHLLGDPALGQRMGRAGRQRVADHFTIAHTVARIQDLYRAIACDLDTKRHERPALIGKCLAGGAVLLLLYNEISSNRRDAKDSKPNH